MRCGGRCFGRRWKSVSGVLAVVFSFHAVYKPAGNQREKMGDLNRDLRRLETGKNMRTVPATENDSGGMYSRSTAASRRQATTCSVPKHERRPIVWLSMMALRIASFVRHKPPVQCVQCCHSYGDVDVSRRRVLYGGTTALWGEYQQNDVSARFLRKKSKSNHLFHAPHPETHVGMLRLATAIRHHRQLPALLLLLQ